MDRENEDDYDDEIYTEGEEEKRRLEEQGMKNSCNETTLSYVKGETRPTMEADKQEILAKMDANDSVLFSINIGMVPITVIKLIDTGLQAQWMPSLSMFKVLTITRNNNLQTREEFADSVARFTQRVRRESKINGEWMNMHYYLL